MDFRAKEAWLKTALETVKKTAEAKGTSDQPAAPPATAAQPDAEMQEAQTPKRQPELPEEEESEAKSNSEPVDLIESTVQDNIADAGSNEDENITDLQES